jgi:chromosome segregation ATPase
MNNKLIKSTLIALLLTSACSIYAASSDLTTQQYRVNSVQDQYNEIKKGYESIQYSIDEQEAVIKSQEERLKLDKSSLEQKIKERQIKEKQLKRLKSTLDQEEKVLNELWDKKHK